MVIEKRESVYWDRPPAIDLRWEVSAHPTAEMWSAMQSAKLGMADVGEDPQVRELEALAADLSGQEAAILVPTTTVGNVLAILGYAPRGSIVLMEDRCHIHWVEQGHVSAFAGATTQLIHGDKFGAIALGDIEAALTRKYFGRRQPVSMLCLENTHNICGGTILTAAYMAEVVDLCHRYGVTVFVDGARLFNAAVGSGVSLRELASPADAVVIGLSKGLAVPFGSLLCGTREFVDQAKVNYRRIGALSMHRAGIYAAAGLVALRTMVERLAEDHARARRLAEAVRDMDGLRVDLETVQTNLVRVETDESGYSAVEFASALAAEGIAVHAFEEQAFKFAVHVDIDDADIDATIDATKRVVHAARRSPS